MLEARNVPHRLVRFDPAFRSAREVAQAAGVDPACVLKTLVIEQDPPRAKPYIVMAPAEAEVDLKLLAATLGVKRLRMASHADAERLTGLKVGGISALALTGRGFPVLVAASALEHDLVLVSAGTRGADVELRPVDLIALTGARPVPL
jgi:Cys-tRNA(Pro)/Cys-tRNA(Cys) deacylase